jgi:type I restriction enzyme M protein
VAKTSKTELLFLVLMMRMLKNGGKCAVIVPDGVLFGSSAAHQAVRRMLIEDNQLDAVVSLPSGVFKPYAGVSTAILFFTKVGGKGIGTENVWFYKVENDGYSLDDKREPIPGSDLPDLVQQWRKRNPKKMKDKTAKYFFVPKGEIAEQKYDLSFNRYHEQKYEEKTYEAPKVILDKLRTLEQEILSDIDQLEAMLG